MIRKFISNLSILVLLNLVVKPVWIFGIDREVQNLMGNETYGTYFALFNISILLNMILDFGITNFNNRNIAQHRQLLTKHFSGIISAKIFLGILYAVSTILFAVLLDYSKTAIYMLMFLAFNQFLASFTLYLRSNLSALHHFKLDSVISVTDRFLMIILCGILLFSPLRQNFEILWFVYAQTVAYSMTFLFVFVLVLKKAVHFKLQLNIPFLIMVIKRSLPYATLVLFMTLYYRLDSIMLDRMLPNGAAETGIYAQAFRIFDAANMLGFLFSSLLLPMFAYLLKEKEAVFGLFITAIKLIFLPTILVACLSSFYAFDVISALYVGNIIKSSQVFSILMWCWVFSSIVYICGTLLTADGHLKFLNVIAIVGMILNFVLNYYLIPSHQAIGAAYASIVTQSIVVIAHIIVILKEYSFPLISFRMVKWALFAVVLFVVSAFSMKLPFHWFINCLMVSSLAIALTLGLKLITIKDLRKLVTTNK